MINISGGQSRSAYQSGYRLPALIVGQDLDLKTLHELAGAEVIYKYLGEYLAGLLIPVMSVQIVQCDQIRRSQSHAKMPCTDDLDLKIVSSPLLSCCHI
jgi:hypothetical protein